MVDFHLQGLIGLWIYCFGQGKMIKQASWRVKGQALLTSGSRLRRSELLMHELADTKPETWEGSDSPFTDSLFPKSLFLDSPFPIHPQKLCFCQPVLYRRIMTR